MWGLVGEFTKILRFSGENAILLDPSEGFEGVKFFPQLHYASSNEGPAPKASTMPKPCPKREVPKSVNLCVNLGA